MQQVKEQNPAILDLEKSTLEWGVRTKGWICSIFMINLEIAFHEVFGGNYIIPDVESHSNI